PPPRTLFPYTTLFRSRTAGGARPAHARAAASGGLAADAAVLRGDSAVAEAHRLDHARGGDRGRTLVPRARAARAARAARGGAGRSEEHTSELQSRENL